jgi:hypothetical protein
MLTFNTRASCAYKVETDQVSVITGLRRVVAPNQSNNLRPPLRRSRLV